MGSGIIEFPSDVREDSGTMEGMEKAGPGTGQEAGPGHAGKKECLTPDF